MSKLCTYCREVKPLSEFHRRSKVDEQSRQNYCRSCSAMVRRAYPATLATKRVGRPVVQRQNGQVIAVYPSVKAAAEQTGIRQPNISACLSKSAITAKGYEFVYEDLIKKEVTQ